MAAINYFRKYDEIEISEWDDVFKVNLRAMFIICREVSRSMKKMKYGRIVNVSSIAEGIGASQVVYTMYQVKLALLA